MQPGIQKRAREELDVVVGPDRLPTFEDYDELPYIQAIIMECSRWLPVAPLAIPHRSIADDYYNGYFIPEGTMIIAVCVLNSFMLLVSDVSSNRTLGMSSSLYTSLKFSMYYSLNIPPGICSAIRKTTLIRNDSILRGS